MVELAKRLGAVLIDRGLTLSVAESCTGGMLGAAITAISGSSEYFKGGVIAYANEIKENLIRVPKELLETKGAVSAEAVEVMARGVAELCKTQCGIAVSGIAGPDGGTPEKPVGLVFIGYYMAGASVIDTCRFNGNRDSIRRQAVEAGLTRMIEIITGCKG